MTFCATPGCGKAPHEGTLCRDCLPKWKEELSRVNLNPEVRSGDRGHLLLPSREARGEGRIYLSAEDQLALMSRCRVGRDDADWNELLDLLNLPSDYAPAVELALKESDWQASQSRRSYLRQAAKRIAERKFGLKISELRPKIVHVRSEAALDHAAALYEENFPRTTYRGDGEGNHRGVWKKIGRGVYRWNSPSIHELPLRFLRRMDDGRFEVNWSALGPELTVMGVTLEEQIILMLRLGDDSRLGLTRKEILSIASNSQERKKFQAAYRSLSDKLPKILTIRPIADSRELPPPWSPLWIQMDGQDRKVFTLLSDEWDASMVDGVLIERRRRSPSKRLEQQLRKKQRHQEKLTVAMIWEDALGAEQASRGIPVLPPVQELEHEEPVQRPLISHRKHGRPTLFRGDLDRLSR